MSTLSPNYRFAARSIREWLFLAAALLLVGGVMGWNLYTDHNTIDAGERERLAHQASVIDENLARQLLATNLALESIRRGLPLLKAQKDGKALINRRLQAMSDTMQGVGTLFILDADATVTASNRKELIGLNFREREYVQTARQSRNPAMLHLSAPYKTVLGAFAMTLVKVITDDRGQVVGMVGATIDPEYFKTLLDSVRYAPDMWTSLAHGDGKLFLMRPEQPGVEGTDLDKPGSFRNRHLATGQQATVMTGIVYATGEERMMAQRIIKPTNLLMDKALAVAVARDLPTIFAVWRRGAYEKAALFGLLTLIATIGLFLNQQRQRAYARGVASREAERKLAEAALQRTQALLAQAEELGKVGGWEFDTETGQQIWTKAVYDIHELDITAHPTVDQGVNFYTPASRPIIEQAVQRAIEQGEPYDVELEIITAKGKLRSVHAIGKPDPARRRIYGFFQDITERKQAEIALLESEKLRVREQAAALEAQRQGRLAALNLMEDAVAARSRIEAAAAALRESEARSRAITQSAYEAIVTSDGAGNIAGWNRGAGIVFGYTEAQAMGQPMTLLIPERYREGHLAGMNRIRSGEQPRLAGKTVELHGLRQDGSEFPLELTLARWETAGGWFVTAIISDITERKQTEEKNMRQLDELRRWQAVMLEREDRNITLKREVNALLRRLGEPIRYPSQEGGGSEKP